jgi:type IV secretion system protein VirD4
MNKLAKIALYSVAGILGIVAYVWLWGFLYYLLLFKPQIPALNWIIPHVSSLVFLNDKVRFIFIASGLLPIGLMTLLIIDQKDKKRSSSLYGDAHWASWSEIKKMGLFAEDGIILGTYMGKLVRTPLKSHMLVFAPSRSGKGVSHVIPNALTWDGSLLVTDMKLEVFNYTSGYRAKHGQSVYCFSPGSPDNRTHCYNPLDYVSKDNKSQQIADLQLISEILIRSQGSENSMWVEEARSITVGLLLWMLTSDKPFNLGELASIVKGVGNLTEFLKDILLKSVAGNNLLTIHPAAYQAINSFVGKAPKEQSGVKSTLTSCLRLWEDPFIIAATSKSDFDLRQMRNEKITIYLGVPVNQINRLAPIMNLFIQQFITAMTKNLPTENEPYRVLAILDEIANFGRMDILKDSYSYLAGFNVHLMPIIQNLGQFYSVYGGRDNCDVFLQNTDCKIGYRQNSHTDQKYISELLGTKTVESHSFSSPKGLSGKNSSITKSYISRPLLTPDEVFRFDSKKAICLISGEYPIQLKRLIYYKDKRLSSRIIEPITLPYVAPCVAQLDINKNDVLPKNTIDKHTTQSREDSLLGALANSYNVGIED